MLLEKLQEHNPNRMQYMLKYEHNIEQFPSFTDPSPCLCISPLHPHNDPRCRLCCHFPEEDKT